MQRTLEITKVNSDLRREVTERLNAENALRQLSQNVVQLQDENGAELRANCTTAPGNI